MMAAPRLSYCAEQVQKFDNDRFLCSLFAPPVEREALAAVGAFNIELARIREQAHQPLLGHMRLRWWSDALDAVFAGAPPQHPVAAALAEAALRFGISREPFDRMLEGRAADLDDSAPQSLAALIEYAEATSGALAAAGLQVLAVADAETQAAAQDVAIAWTLVGLVRAVPFHARARRVYLPADLSREAGLDIYRLFERGPTEGLRPVVQMLIDVAVERLNRARGKRRAVAPAALPVLLPARLADLYIERLRRADFDPFDPRVRTKPRWPMLRLTAARLRQCF
ncbi:MAG: phytoene/squalene synthase family protein [Rhodospirillales bacterium]